MRIKTLQGIDFYLGNFLLLILHPLARLIHRRVALGEHPRSIVVMKLFGGGSLLIAAPSLLVLRKRYPDAVFTLLATHATKPFGELTGLFDEIRLIDDRSFFKLMTSSLKVLWQCWIRRCDLLLDLEVYSRLSAVFSLLTFARIRAGFYSNMAFFRKGIYTCLFFLNPYGGIYRFYDALLTIVDPIPAVPDPEEYRNYFRERLPKFDGQITDNTVVIAPFCSDLCEFRRWDQDKWIEWIKLFHSHYPDWTVALVGGSADKENADVLVAALPEVPVINFCGTLSLAKSAALIRNSRTFVGIDSAPLHIARLAAERVLSLWGATRPEALLRDFPFLIEKRIQCIAPCSPCVHIVDVMPCRRGRNCMSMITPEQVFEAFETMMKQWGPGCEKIKFAPAIPMIFLEP